MLRLVSPHLASLSGAVLPRVLLAVLLLVGVALTPSDAEADGTFLTIPISKVRSQNGSLYVGIYTRANWLKPGRQTTYQKVRAVKGTIRLNFEGLKPGRYAAGAFHDENSNGKVDFNFLGLPSEGYGFSRTTPFGKPNFDDTAFDLQGRKEMPIRLKY